MAEKRTIAKAKEIFESNGIEKIDDDLFRVKSVEDSTRNYIVKENKCNCMGYKLYSSKRKTDRECCHVVAVNYSKKKEAINSDASKSD